MQVTECGHDSCKTTKGDFRKSEWMTMAEDGAWTKALSCPLTWDTPEMTCMSLPLSTAGGVADELDSLPTPWHRLVDMITLAYSYLTEGRETDGVALLRNCYMMLLPQPFCQHDCAIIGEYRMALRHILDSFWAMVEWHRAPSTTALLRDFVKTITPFNELSPALQAAIHAVRGAVSRLQREISLACVARSLELNDREGEWHSMGGRLAATWAVKVQHLRTAHRLRPGPHTGLALATELAMKPKGRAEARQLLEEALRRYPDHPHVLTNAGDVLIQIRGLTKTTVAEAERLLGRCKAITGDKSYLHLRLAGLCRRQGGRSEEATRHYEEAIRLNPADAAMIRLYHLPNSPCDTCGRVCSDGNEGGEIRCHHERLARVYQHTLTSNTYA
ncbi:uncharacterized protein LOC117645853 isoform X3 [Thrips palmi]|uniref:Uncharacterized protein LOC117645853 isoform X3 n=1 Tax=Thrips palmi TaxID=161013 RepID=A0A6P8YXA2_THRPL|nr:uncharacterized protein LOC117645853 isoform X3 [Thrips palmi]